jgi:hypothetical protein
METNLGLAKHFDIPLPLTFKQTSSSTQERFGNAHDRVVYSGSLPLHQTLDFYLREMEVSGWDAIDLSSKTEGFLFCQKPSKQCGISIRSMGKQTSVIIFVKQKADRP